MTALPPLSGESSTAMSGHADMAAGYLRSRLFAAIAVGVSAAGLALSWQWVAGWSISAIAFIVAIHAAVRLRFGSRRQILVSLLVDMTAIGLAIALSGLPPLIAVAPFFYELVSAVFALSRRLSVVVVLYAVAWNVAIIGMDFTASESSLNQTQQQVVAAIAVAIYFGATYLMASTAAEAIRERHRLNDDLREKESRLQTVVDSTPIVLYAIDGDGVFTLSEGPGLRLLGLEPGQVVGLRVADVYGDNPEVLAMVNAALASDTDSVHEVSVGDRCFLVRHRPRVNAAGVREGTVGVAIDVTAEATYRRELENQIRSKDEFVASVSHELRTPLSVVFGLGEELRRNGADLAADEIAELHNLLAEQAGEVVAIVEDLLVAARADIDSLVVVGEVVDVGSQVTAALQPMMADHSVTVEAPSEPVLAWCDGPRARQILRNLLANAARHGGERIEIAYGATGDQIFVEIRDDGPGVPAADEDHIFDAYHRSEAAAGNPASIGLGLTVAKKLAHLMNGDLSYERRAEWSIFTLSLPAPRVAARVP